jgi:hypothetical protein
MVRRSRLKIDGPVFYKVNSNRSVSVGVGYSQRVIWNASVIEKLEPQRVVTQKGIKRLLPLLENIVGLVQRYSLASDHIVRCFNGC